METTQPHANLLDEFSQDIENGGLVGERDNAQIVFLTAISAKMKQPLNLTVMARSSTGKNHLLACVARFLPDESQLFLTGLTPKTMMHAKPDAYKHKALFIAEYEGVSGADYAVRTMQSEGRITWQWTESTGEGLRHRSNTTEGPVAFLQATTRSVLHPENETRLLFIELDESPEQTRAINKRQALEATKMLSHKLPDYAKWHDRIREIPTGLSVAIPYALEIVEHFPDSNVRSRRDFPKFLGLIEAHALLNHNNRQRDSRGNLIANLDDYRAAKRLFEHVHGRGPDAKVRQLLTAARSEGLSYRLSRIQRRLGWSLAQTYSVHGRALELGFVEAVEDGKRGEYQVVGTKSCDSLDLPEPEAFSSNSNRDIYQPNPVSSGIRRTSEVAENKANTSITSSSGSLSSTGLDGEKAA